MTEALELVGSIMLALGGGTAIVYALSKHLASLWTQRTLERERSVLAREQEILIRRRDIYAQLARTLRVFLASPLRDASALAAMQTEFLAAYDEAALWASEEVVEAVSALLDFNADHAGRVADQQQYKKLFVACITAMRRDSGFPDTAYRHRPMVFA